MPEVVRNRRLSKPVHVRNLMAELINQLRQNQELDPIERARVIGYLSNILLNAHKEGETADKLEQLEKMLIESGVIK